MFISIIITTYNWPKALSAVLQALNNQTNKNFEIIIADDGSTQDTKELIDGFKANFSVSIKHIWQEDKGFRAARCRNKATINASHDYIVFLDGDCIPLPTFVDEQIKLAEDKYFVVGNRVLLSQNFTQMVLNKSIEIFNWKFKDFLLARLRGQCNKILAILNLPFPRKIYSKKWQGAKGCNLAIWKKDLLNVNGWDESFTGWGYEDSDLVIRLINADIKRKEGKFKVPVLHLWHKENDRSFERKNWDMLQGIITDGRTLAIKGLSSSS